METRKRIFGHQYELARIYAPVKEGEFILSKRHELKHGKGSDVYNEIKELERQEIYGRKTLDWSYLRYLFFCLQTETPIHIVRMAGTVMHKPTDEIEHEVQPWQERECIELSLRVRLQDYQLEPVRQMLSIVEKKMRSFATDFLFHDMKTFARELGSQPMLWVVGKSHTFNEVLWPEQDAEDWVNYASEERRAAFLRGEDDTWMGAALRVSIGKDDLLYFIDSAGGVHKQTREKFEAMHERHVERVRDIIKQNLDYEKKAYSCGPVAGRFTVSSSRCDCYISDRVA